MELMCVYEFYILFKLKRPLSYDILYIGFNQKYYERKSYYIIAGKTCDQII